MELERAVFPRCSHWNFLTNHYAEDLIQRRIKATFRDLVNVLDQIRRQINPEHETQLKSISRHGSA